MKVAPTPATRPAMTAHPGLRAKRSHDTTQYVAATGKATTNAGAAKACPTLATLNHNVQSAAASIAPLPQYAQRDQRRPETATAATTSGRIRNRVSLPNAHSLVRPTLDISSGRRGYRYHRADRLLHVLVSRRLGCAGSLGRSHDGVPPSIELRAIHLAYSVLLQIQKVGAWVGAQYR
jgi:hypothetical protein